MAPIWSNLTSIFFKWMAQPPTRIALDRTESVCLSFAWLMCSRALKFIKYQHQKSNNIDMPLPASLKKRYVKFHAYQLCSTMGMCIWNSMTSALILYTHIHPCRSCIGGNPRNTKRKCVTEDKSMVHDVEQFVVMALGSIFLCPKCWWLVNLRFTPHLSGTHRYTNRLEKGFLS